MNTTVLAKTLFSAIETSANSKVGYDQNDNVSVLSAHSSDSKTILTTISHPVDGGSVQVSVRSLPYDNFPENVVPMVIYTHAKYAEYMREFKKTGNHEKVWFRSTIEQQLIDIELSNNTNAQSDDEILDELCGEDCTPEERESLRDTLNTLAECLKEYHEQLGEENED